MARRCSGRFASGACLGYDLSSWSPASTWPTGWLDQKLVRGRARVTPHRSAARWSLSRPAPISILVLEGALEPHGHVGRCHRCCGGCGYPPRHPHPGDHTSTGATLATTTVTNTAEGTAQALAWIAEHAPGQRVVAAVEGSRSYGVGLSRALSTAGLPVIEIEQPHRRERRRGKSDSIDAHLAAIHALRLDVDRLPTPRAD